MKLLTFSFDKISIEKFSQNFENVKINTNIDVSEIKKANADFFKLKEELLGVKFFYILEYQEHLAKIEFAGTLLISIPFKEAKEVLKQWEEKKMPEDFKIALFNIIMRRSNIKAIQLEDDLNLPLHVPLPQLGRMPPDTPKDN